MTFQLPEQSVDRLEKMKEVAGLTSYTEVIRQSLQLYEWMVKEVQNGSEIEVRDANGKVKVVGPLLFG